MENSVGDSSAPLEKWRSDFSRSFQHYLDKSTPHVVGRWLGTAAIAGIFLLRVYFVQGFYIVTYGLGIYLLNLLIGFLSPIVDPEMEVTDEPSLPMRGSDEFKPFIRRLPEFKFCNIFVRGKVTITTFAGILLATMWQTSHIKETLVDLFISLTYLVLRYSITKAFCVAFFMTFFSVIDVPVFWPILLFYWIVLFYLTMKRQILHMIKYKYVPFNIGKQRYDGKKAPGSSSLSKD